MTRKAKKILFTLSVVTFLIMSAIAVLYAQGYAYSFGEGRFQLTGAFSLKTNEGARVFVDGKFMGDTSFFGNGFNVDRLLPGDYEVVVQRDGYASWRKKVTVEEGFLTDFPRVLLVPNEGPGREALLTEIENVFATPLPSPTLSVTPRPTRTPRPAKTVTPSPTPEVFEDRFVLRDRKLYEVVEGALVERFDQVTGFTLTQDENTLVWWDAHEVWVLWLADTNYQPFKKAREAELIVRLSSPIESIKWFDARDHVVVKTTSKTGHYKIIEIDKRGGVNIVDL